MGVERRVSHRVAVAWRAKVLVPTRGMLRGVIKDVTTAGAYLEIDCTMPSKHVFLIEFYPFIGAQMFTVRARGEITFDTLLSDSSGHGLGVRFLQISQSDKAVIRNALIG